MLWLLLLLLVLVLVLVLLLSHSTWKFEPLKIKEKIKNRVAI